jgi:hypothetical protein
MRLGVFVYDQMVIFTVIFNGAKLFASMVTSCHLSTLIDTMNFFNVASFLFCFFFLYLFFGPIRSDHHEPIHKEDNGKKRKFSTRTKLSF